MGDILKLVIKRMKRKPNIGDQINVVFIEELLFKRVFFIEIFFKGGFSCLDKGTNTFLFQLLKRK